MREARAPSRRLTFPFSTSPFLKAGSTDCRSSGCPDSKFGKYHHLEEQVDPDSIDRRVNAADELVLREFAEAYFPAGSGPTLASKVCMFTNSPDENFLIGRHLQHPRVAVAAGFSGHGYKFCSVVGEIVADLVLDGRTEHDISLFSLDRFGRAPG